MDVKRFALLLLLVTTFAPDACAQMSDSFEAGEPRWQLVDSDCQASLARQEISRHFAHGGQACELLELVCGNGTQALLAYPIEPCAVLNEFTSQVWTRSSSGKIRLGARIVFPHTSHPVTGGRLIAIVWGDSYTSPGQWQRLELRDAERLLQIEKVAMRQQYGSDLNLNGEYMDCIVVNAYTGPGRFSVQLDDVNLRGLIALSSLGQAVAPNWRSNWRWRIAGATPEERRWSPGNTNRPPTYFQYQGESLAWLRSLGCRGLLLDRQPNRDLLEEIRQAELAVICPPPTLPIVAADGQWSHVKAWMIGSAVDARQSQQISGQIAKLADFPESLRRPTVAEVLEQFWMFSRLTDEVIIPSPSPSSAGEPKEKIAWLANSVEISGKRAASWISIPTDETAAWRDQFTSARNLLDPANADQEIPSDPLQIRLQAMRAVSAGARAFLMRSSYPLDVNTASGRARVAAVRATNRDLTLLGPWIVGGQSIVPPKLSREDYYAAAWTCSRSHFVLLHSASAGGNLCPAPTADKPLECVLPIPFGTLQAIRLTGGTMERLPLVPTAEGLKWSVERPAGIEMFVITDNPLVSRFVTRELVKSAMEAAEDQLDIAAYQLNTAAQTADARWQGSLEPGARHDFRMIESGQGRLDQGLQALRGNRLSAALAAAHEAIHASQSVLYSAFTVACQNLAAPQSSPFVLHPASLKYHWQLARACEKSSWSPLPLPGEDLPSIDRMLSQGWSQQRRLEEQAHTLVELLPRDPRSGSAGLRLAAHSKNEEPLAGGYEGATVRIRTSPASVRQGQLVRFQCKARVRVVDSAADSGLLVYDNQAGPSIGQLVRGQPGEVINVELFRFIQDSSEFRVLAELRGACDIVLESISLSVIEPAINRQIFPTMPVESASTISISQAR